MSESKVLLQHWRRGREGSVTNRNGGIVSRQVELPGFYSIGGWRAQFFVHVIPSDPSRFSSAMKMTLISCAQHLISPLWHPKNKERASAVCYWIRVGADWILLLRIKMHVHFLYFWFSSHFGLFLLSGFWRFMLQIFPLGYKEENGMLYWQKWKLFPTI